MFEYTVRPIEGEADYQFGVTLSNANLSEKLGLTYSIEQIRHFWKQKKNHLNQGYIVEMDGQPVGAMGFNEIPSDDGKLRLFFGGSIMPQYHSVQFLHDILIDLLQRVDEHKPDELRMGLFEFQIDHIGFAESQGFEKLQRDQFSELRLSEFDFAAFAGTLDRVTATGIQLVTVPEYEEINPDYKAALVELNNAIFRDVPGLGSLVATVDQFEENVLQNPNILRDAWILALDGEQLVGMTYISRFGNAADCVTNLTGVLRSHRRRGITTAMKVAAFQIVRNMGFKRILTSNEENNPMYQINLKFGFKPGPASFLYAKQMTTE